MLETHSRVSPLAKLISSRRILREIIKIGTFVTNPEDYSPCTRRERSYKRTLDKSKRWLTTSKDVLNLEPSNIAFKAIPFSERIFVFSLLTFARLLMLLDSRIAMRQWSVHVELIIGTPIYSIAGRSLSFARRAASFHNLTARFHLDPWMALWTSSWYRGFFFRLNVRSNNAIKRCCN